MQLNILDCLSSLRWFTHPQTVSTYRKATQGIPSHVHLQAQIPCGPSSTMLFSPSPPLPPPGARFFFWATPTPYIFYAHSASRMALTGSSAADSIMRPRRRRLELSSCEQFHAVQVNRTLERPLNFLVFFITTIMKPDPSTLSAMPKRPTQIRQHLLAFLHPLLKYIYVHTSTEFIV